MINIIEDPEQINPIKRVIIIFKESIAGPLVFIFRSRCVRPVEEDPRNRSMDHISHHFTDIKNRKKKIPTIILNDFKHERSSLLEPDSTLPYFIYVTTIVDETVVESKLSTKESIKETGNI